MPGIIKEMKGLDCPAEKEEALHPYVLIIDEINRGNVSQIFGELITLIEDDKRMGMEEALEVKLPYSKNQFSVPQNLYIIGTMNTADRSVEALDAALRRRFSFEEMPPRPELIKTEGELKDDSRILDGKDLAVLLTTINQRIEKLLDKDHKIGHSYFMQVTTAKALREAFRSKIIPLLQEYFFGDIGKIRLVLGDGFFKPQEEQKGNSIFAPTDFGRDQKFGKRDLHHFIALHDDDLGADETAATRMKSFVDAIAKLWSKAPKEPQVNG
jgi:5-methylcytosine-specific restriction protein B